MHKETVTIKKLINGGYGLGYLPSNQVVLVRFTLPGENIIVNTEESNKNYQFGKVVRIEKNHPARISPPCQYYGKCGGCNLQHCDYQTQAILKREIVVDLLSRQGVCNADKIEGTVQETITAPTPFHYRQRIRLQVGDGNIIGFHRHRSNDIVEISKCLLAQHSINTALTGIRKSGEHQPLLELTNEIELQQDPSTDLVSCILHFKRKPRPADYKRATALCSSVPSIDRVFFCGENFSMEGPVNSGKQPASKFLKVSYAKIQGLQNGLSLSWEAGGFCQVNLAQNRQMIETVLQMSKAKSSDTVLDLFCGMGNFSIPISQIAASVLGYEAQGASIRCAKENSKASSRPNSTFIKQQVQNGCESLLEQKKCFDIIIVDPPRQGLAGLSGQLKNLCRKRLIYISCDPATLCRDLEALTAEGFRLTTIQPIDMFPQTHHIETVALLEK